MSFLWTCNLICQTFSFYSWSPAVLDIQLFIALFWTFVHIEQFELYHINTKFLPSALSNIYHVCLVRLTLSFKLFICIFLLLNQTSNNLNEVSVAGQTSCSSSRIPSSSCVFPQTPQRSPWHHPVLTLKWVRTPGCSAPHHTTPLWTSPSSGHWMAELLTCTRTVNIMNALRWGIILIILMRNEHWLDCTNFAPTAKS